MNSEERNEQRNGWHEENAAEAVDRWMQNRSLKTNLEKEIHANCSFSYEYKFSEFANVFCLSIELQFSGSYIRYSTLKNIKLHPLLIQGDLSPTLGVRPCPCPQRTAKNCFWPDDRAGYPYILLKIVYKKLFRCLHYRVDWTNVQKGLRGKN